MVKKQTKRIFSSHSTSKREKGKAGKRIPHHVSFYTKISGLSSTFFVSECRQIDFQKKSKLHQLCRYLLCLHILTDENGDPFARKTSEL